MNLISDYNMVSNFSIDRTSELRKKGYQGRRLGPVQMTTDTAVRTTRIVVQDRIELENIKYVDNPEIKVDEHESTEMPFRYVLDKNGNPIFPDVRKPFSIWQLRCVLTKLLGHDRSDQEGL
jgi:hypothetical protein